MNVQPDSEQATTPNATASSATDDAIVAPRKRRRLGTRGLLYAGLIVGAAVSFILPASAHEGERGHKATPKKVRAKMGNATDFALELLDGTDRQRKALDPVLDRLANDMANVRNEGRALRKSFINAALADTFDAKHVEKLRAEGIALADKTSKRLVAELAKVHAILTPEQRTKLRRIAKKAAKRHSRR